MACGILDPVACVPIIADPVGSVIGGASSSLVDGVLSELSGAISAAITSVVGLLSSWLLIPTPAICPTAVPSGTGAVGGDWVTQCQAVGSAATLRGYVLPVTLLIAVFGLLWQGIVMTVTRKGEPLLQVVRGLWNTALWGAVGIAGTQLALHAGDSFADWVIETALHTSNPGPGNQAFTAALGGMLVANLGSVPIVGIVVGIVIIMVVILQTIMMVFRAAAITVMAGMLQLAAAGSFTRTTSPWMGKVVGPVLALVAYKPAAALVYATGLAFTSGQGTANFIIGLAVLALSIIALPALMKFFTWTVGSASTGSSIGIFGAGAAAGVHAASSLRGLGGNSAAEHSRYLDNHGPGSGGPGSSGPTGSGNPGGPGGPAGPGGPGAGGGPGPKVLDGAVASSGPAGAGATTPATSVAAGTGATAATGSVGAAAGGAGTAAGAGAAAASGPAAPVVLGAVVATQAATSAATSAVNAATSAMDGPQR
jgi:hypothetical protein